jgi:predicted nucleic acid-binding protein
MIVVADTSPILYLVLINQVELLHTFYGEVIIPDAVATELDAAKSPAPVRTWISTPPSWAEVRTVTPDQLARVTAELDSGERAAIALANALSADLLLIDDARGRAEARRRRLVVTGTMGVLRTAAERHLIDVPQVLEQLRATSFYVDDTLIEELFGGWL